jgi:hypothetical protein
MDIYNWFASSCSLFSNLFSDILSFARENLYMYYSHALVVSWWRLRLPSLRNCIPQLLQWIFSLYIIAYTAPYFSRVVIFSRRYNLRGGGGYNKRLCALKFSSKIRLPHFGQDIFYWITTVCFWS